MRIQGLIKFRGRNPRGYFADLPWEVRQRAYHWLHLFQRRWGRNLPRWRFAILVGQAKRLARTTPEERSKWGRSMLGRRGGLAAQRRYHIESRHPTQTATQSRVSQRKAVKRTLQPGFQRVWSGNLEGI